MIFKSPFAAKIRSTGRYLPERVVTNEELTQFPQYLAKVIKEKTGVSARRYAAADESTSDLASQAAKACLVKGEVDPDEIDAIILATSSPDQLQPPTAARVQTRLGASRAFAFDINAVCSGSVYGMYLGDCLIRAGLCKKVMVIGAEIYSRFLNHKDFATCPYFGDGAGAVLLEREEDGKAGIILGTLHTDGNGADLISVPAGGSKRPGWEVTQRQEFYFRMQGREVYDFAVIRGSEVINECLFNSGFSAEDIKCVLAHQANENILREISKRTGIPLDKFFINLYYYGNTAAASVLIALDEAIDGGRLKKDDLIMLVAFGGGLSWGAILLRM